jgi:OmpA-OmpF porin, OOP family
MLRHICFVGGLLLSTAAYSAPADYTAEMAVDAKGAADSAFTGRYEGSTIVGQTFKKFDEIVLPAGPADLKTKAFSKTVSQKGTVLRTLYVSPEERSSLEVFGNYIDALKAKGFTPVFECANLTCGKNFKDLKYQANDVQKIVLSDNASNRRLNLSRGMFIKIVDPRYALLQKGEAGNETYVAVFAGQNAGGSFGDVSKALRSRVGVLIEVVEPAAREEKIVTLSADDISNSLGADGRVAIYGLFFDFDKAVVKPESEPQLSEMISYLKNNPAEKVYVVGHTDNQGDLDYNLKLSGARAKSVVAALIDGGIVDGRLASKGVGPLAPLATNQTEAGKAKNRRVELVAR